MAEDIRIGKISKVDYKTGRVAVTYSDKDDEVTDLLPVLHFNGEYHMPKVEQYVAVMHLSNGSEMGVVLGGYWNTDNKPAVNGKDIYRKEYSHTQGKAYAQHTPSSGELVLKADHIKFQTTDGTVTVAQLVRLVQLLL